MARYTGPVCRLCRREGEKLFLKGDRCYSSKCAIERREGQPGQHPKIRGRVSEFKTQLREKQKVKRMYGMLERQFRNLFKRADASKGVTGENLLQMLESRLDNMVYRAGFSSSRKEGRQLISHGHIVVNGRRVTIPSYRVAVGDKFRVSDKAKSFNRVNESLNGVESRRVPEWLELSREAQECLVRALPTRTQLTHPMKENLIVELYSK